MPAGPSLFDIRKWRGTQQHAFEELCFQLRDPDPPAARAVKPGTPDRGVDWYLITASGDRLGRQCKFVDDIDAALPQMRESLRTALRELPDLVEMTFWVPFELAEATPAARGGGHRRSARERWDEAVARWRTEIEGGERLASIELVDGPKILERLTKDEHRGRLWFFFHKELFSIAWCRRQLEVVRALVGPRYRPDLNVELPVSYALDGLALSQRFLHDVGGAQRDLLSALKVLEHERLSLLPEGESLLPVSRAFTKTAREFLWAGRLVSERPPIAAALAACIPLEDALGLARDAYWDARDANEAGEPSDRTKAELGAASHYIGAAHSALKRYRSLLAAPAAGAAESSAVLLHGGAGEGKTHLLCDAAERLLDTGHPAVVLLGGHFPPGGGWSTIAAELGLEDRGYEQLIGAMEAAAETAGRRFVLLIDALNESSEPRFWQQQLEAVRVHTTRSGLVAVAASCRTTYLGIVGVDPADTRWTLVEHRGLEGREDEAAAKYFEHYGVQAPRVPLLHPDLTTPLFLKLYCEGLQGGVPPGSGPDTATAIFSRLVRTHAQTIDDRLELDPADRVTERALDAFAAALIDAGRAYLARDAARDLFIGLVPTRDKHPRTLLHQLLDTGLLGRDIVRDDDGTEVEVVRFAYNRFSDHVVAKGLLDRHLDPDAPMDAFQNGRPLRAWAVDGDAGVLEALTNQLPERTGIELLDALNADQEGRPFRSWLLRLLIRALPHRNPDAISDRSIELLHENEQTRTFSETFELLCLLAPNPDHPLGGDLLHRNLVRAGSMAERDASWGSVLERAGDPYGGMHRLLRWAQRGPYPEYDAEVIESACLPLVWLLSTTNRPVRDHATKALAHVLQRHLGPAAALVTQFATVPEPAIHERLAVACHGAVLRGGHHDHAGARVLLDAMASIWIDGEHTLPDPVARDAVRGVAEWLHEHALLDGAAVVALSPPYRSRAVANPRSRAFLESRYPSIPYDEPGTGYEVLRRAIDGPMGDHLRQVIMPAIERFPRPRSDGKLIPHTKDWAERWLFQRAVTLGWTPERFGSHDRANRVGPRGRARHEGFADKYVAIAFRELLARLADHRPMRERYGREAREYGGPWQLDLREVDPTLPPSRSEISDEGDERHLPPLELDPQDAWWVGHAVDWEPSEAVGADWGAEVNDLPTLPNCVRVADPDGRRWVRLEGHTSFVEPADPTRPEPSSSIAGRDLGFSVQALIVRATDLPRTLAALRAATPDANPEAAIGAGAYLGESPWAAAAHQPEWTWDTNPGWLVDLPNAALLATGDWAWHAGSDDASLPEAVLRGVPALDLWRAGDLAWEGDGAAWHANGTAVLQGRRSTGIYRDVQRGVLADEAWLTQTLRRKGWAIVIKIIGEKHLYNDTDSIEDGIASWLLFGAAVAFDGAAWDGGDWLALQHPPGRIHIDASDVGITVSGDPARRAPEA